MAQFLAGHAAKRVEVLLGRYEALVGSDAAAQELQRLWARYLERHEAWVAAGDAPASAAKQASFGGPLQKAYDAVRLASRQLIDDAKAAAEAEVAAGGTLADQITLLVAILAAVAGLLTAASIMRVVLHITRPLRAVTDALSRLAAGERATRVPQGSRNDEIGDMIKAFDVFLANADALADAQRAAEILSLHDALTGLPNRRLLAAQLNAALASPPGDGSTYAVMLIDLDRFKPINDLRGHAAGDAVLREVGARLKHVIPEAGTVARLGGDEFAVIVRGGSGDEPCAAVAADMARRIVNELEAPIALGEAEVRIGASVGIAVHPADGDSAESLLHAADLAMYQAKNDGRGTFRFFDVGMHQQMRNQAEIEADLRKALSDGEIKPHYQPLVGIETGSIVGFEVLARWHHAERGHVPPDVFIPALEKYGLLGEMTRSLLAQVARDVRGWDPTIRVAVNVSPRQLQDSDFAASLAVILAREDVSASRFEIEVTETGLIEDLKAVRATIKALQELGIRVALDDFGIGVSNLHHLRELKFDKLKIDRSFVQSMRTSPESEKIVHAALNLARSLGMPVVAEGIEDNETVHLLSKLGCDFGQGFFFSRAVPAELAGAMLSMQSGTLREQLAAPASLPLEKRQPRRRGKA